MTHDGAQFVLTGAGRWLAAEGCVLRDSVERASGATSVTKPRGRRWLLLALYVAALLGLTVLWRAPSMRHWLEPQVLSQMGRELLATPLGPVAVIGGYVLAVVMGMPVLVLVSVGALVFEPWPGMLYALVGMVAGAVVTYAVGRFTGAQAMDGLMQGKLAVLGKHLQKRGLLTMITVRVLPLAPFVVINMLAGSMRVRMSDYVLGTLIGLTPGTVLISLFMGQLSQAWQRHPEVRIYLGAAAGLAAVLLAGWLLRRRLAPSSKVDDHPA